MTTPPAAAAAETDAELLAAVRAHAARGDYPAAAALAEAAYRKGVRDPLGLNLLAFREEEAGRFAEALPFLQEALALSPGDPGILLGLGQCLSRLGRHPQAIAAFDAALASRPGHAAALHHKGAVLELLGEDDEAQACYARAAAADPRYADPVAGMASVHLRAGRSEEARGLAQRALALDAGQALAATVLARVELGEGVAPAAEARLRSLLGAPRLDARLRSGAEIFLGDALDAQGRYAEAFEAYARGKALQRRFAPAASGETPTQEADRLADAAARYAAWPAGGLARKEGLRGHAFLVGFPRSGTTLLEQVLASHPDVVALEESDALDAAAAELTADAAALDRLAALDGEALEAQRRRYWAAVSRAGIEVAGRVLVDKLPLNTVRLPLIARLFPQARILFAERDPRDVVLSCFRRNFGVNAAMLEFTSLSGAARFYDAVMRMEAAWAPRLGQDVLRVRHERLVGDFEAEVRAVCAFLELDWRDSLADFAAVAAQRRIRTPSAAQVRRGLYAEALGQWRRYAPQLAEVAPVIDPWVARLGYPAD